MQTYPWNVAVVPCLRDNYAYLLWREGEKEAVAIDPSEAAPVVEALQERGLVLREIWLTHHHWDHVGGIEELVARYQPRAVLGSLYDQQRQRIPSQSQGLEEGPCAWRFGDDAIEVLALPGHTLGAIAYRCGKELFTGDTLFLGGCGRVFEGSMEQMLQAMEKLRALPGDLRVWCGHEYTLNNLAFAREVEGGNPVLAKRAELAAALRASALPTVPGTIAEERATNPFLRWDVEEIAGGEAALASFTRLRRAKDAF